MHGGREFLQGQQFAFQPFQEPSLTSAALLPLAIRFCQGGLVGLFQVHHEFPFVRLRIMNETAQTGESALAQPGIDDVDGRSLLTDEQDAFALCHMVSDQIRDGLRLTGTGRSLDDVAVSGPGLANRRGLRRVAGDNIEAVFQQRSLARLAIHRAGRQREGGLESGIRRLFRQQTLVVAHQRHLAVLEVRQSDVAQVKVPLVRVVLAALF